jgi:hypothetical protein
MDSDNSRNNPYVTEGLERPINESITPDFNPEDSSDRPGSSADSRNNAVKFLRGAEDSAANGTADKDPSDSPIQTADKFENKVTGKNKDDKSRKSGKLSGKGKNFKKAAPVITIFAAILGFGGLLLGSQASLPFAVVARFIDEWNSSSVYSSHRSRSFLKTIQRKMRDGVLSKSDPTVQKLEEGVRSQGGELADDGDIILADSDGKKTRISPDGGVDADGNTKVSTDAVESDGKFSTLKNKLLGAMSTWAGNLQGFFTKTGKKIKTYFGWETSDRFHDYDKKSESDIGTDADAEEQENFRKTAVSPDGEDDTDIKLTTDEFGDEADDDGDTTTKRTNTSAEDLDTNNREKLKGDLEAKAKGLNIASGLCGAWSLIATLQNITSSAQVQQVVNIFTGLAEAVDKAKIGEGTNSPIARYMKSLTQPDPNSNNQTAMQATGLKQLFGSKGNSDADRKSALISNRENIAASASESGTPIAALVNVLGGSAYNTSSYLTCNALDGGASVANLAITIVSLGTSTIVEMLFDAAVNVLSDIASSAIIGGAMDWLAGLIIGEGAKALLGPVYGEYIGSGGAYILGQMHTGHGGSALTSTSLAAFKLEQQAVIAEQAEYERSIHDPLDASSPYTFLGSILYSLYPLASSISSSATMSILSTTGSALSNAFRNFIPSASAIAATDVVTATGNCPQLESIGAVGDAYCNKYTGSDTSTLNADISTIIANINTEANFEETDTNKIIDDIAKGKLPTIKKGSNLARYQTYCGQRNSQLGAIDGQIADVVGSGKEATLIGGNQTLSDIYDSIDNLPIVGDIKAIYDSARKSANASWVNGANCVANSSNSAWENENKWYQAYLEYSSVDESLVETPDTAYNSDGTLALSMFYDPMTDEEYETWLAERRAEKADPDYEYKQIAKYSGYSVAEVKELMNTLTEFIDQQNYDPTNLAPIVTAVKPDGKDQPRNIIEIEAPLIDDSDAINAQSLALATKEKYLLYKQTLATTTA